MRAQERKNIVNQYLKDEYFEVLRHYDTLHLKLEVKDKFMIMTNTFTGEFYDHYFDKLNFKSLLKEEVDEFMNLIYRDRTALIMNGVRKNVDMVQKKVANAIIFISNYIMENYKDEINFYANFDITINVEDDRILAKRTGSKRRVEEFYRQDVARDLRKKADVFMERLNQNSLWLMKGD